MKLIEISNFILNKITEKEKEYIDDYKKSHEISDNYEIRVYKQNMDDIIESFGLSYELLESKDVSINLNNDELRLCQSFEKDANHIPWRRKDNQLKSLFTLYFYKCKKFD
jgi:hypothetical protein